MKLLGKISNSAKLTGKITIGTVVDSFDGMTTFILVDEDGNELAAILTDEEVALTATPNDIRLGTTAVTDKGVTSGEKIIPSYHTSEGYRLITKGSKVIIPNHDTIADDYDYTKLQILICTFNKNESNSTSTEKVSFNNYVYNVQSTEAISEVTKNHESKLIDLGIINDSDSIWLLRFFMYKEIE